MHPIHLLNKSDNSVFPAGRVSEADVGDEIFHQVPFNGGGWGDVGLGRGGEGRGGEGRGGEGRGGEGRGGEGRGGREGRGGEGRGGEGRGGEGRGGEGRGGEGRGEEGRGGEGRRGEGRGGEGRRGEERGGRGEEGRTETALAISILHTCCIQLVTAYVFVCMYVTTYHTYIHTNGVQCRGMYTEVHIHTHTYKYKCIIQWLSVECTLLLPPPLRRSSLVSMATGTHNPQCDVE